jgi:serine/threonine-protein kinase
MQVAFAAIALGFVVTLLLAWYHGEQGRQRVSGTELLLIALVLAVGGALLWRYDRAPTSRRGTDAAHPGKAMPGSAAVAASSGRRAASASVDARAIPIPAKSIAVLPFENLSTDKGNAYFADGIQDEILTGLARIGGLKVISRTSTQRFASAPDNVPDIARQLGVATILEGSVQKSGDRVRINVQLIDAASDNHIWAETYDRKLDDVFAVESEVAEKIAGSLQVAITGRESTALAAKPTAEPAAYAAYLKALALSRRISYTDSGAVENTIAAYREAVAADSGFALAWAGIVKWEVWLYWEGNDPDGSHLAASKRALDRALALAPDLPQVQAAHAWYLYYGTRDFGSSLKAFEQAQQGLPNDAQIWQGTGLVQRRLGKWNAAVAAFTRALRLSPEDLGLVYDLADTLNALRRFHDAEAVVAAGLAMDPRDGELLDIKAFCLWNGDHDRAEIERELAAAPPSPIATGNLARQALYERHFAEAGELFRRAIAGSGDLRSSNSFQDYLDAAIDYRLRLALSEERDGSSAAAADLYRQILDEARKRLAANPANVNIVAALNAAAGLAAAGLGQRGDAVAYGVRATELVPASADATDGPQWQVYLARIYARNHDADHALPLIEHLLASDYAEPLTVRILRVDPVWDPIRDDPRFKALLREPGIAQSPIGGRAGAGHG